MDCWVHISPIQSLGGLHEIHVIPLGEILSGSVKWRYTKKKSESTGVGEPDSRGGYSSVKASVAGNTYI